MSEHDTDVDRLDAIGEYIAGIEKENAKLREALRNLLVMLPNLSGKDKSSSLIPSHFIHLRWCDVAEARAVLQETER